MKLIEAKRQDRADGTSLLVTIQIGLRDAVNLGDERLKEEGGKVIIGALNALCADRVQRSEP